MPDDIMTLWHWSVCSLCSGDGLANMVADPEGNIEEGECPKCEGLGYIKSEGYYELNVTELKALLGL